VHQGGFSGVRIANQRHVGEPLPLLLSRALYLAFGIYRDNLLLKLGDTVTDLVTVQLGV